MAEEMSLLKSQCSKYRRERETYKEMVEGVQKSRPGSANRERVSELQIQMQASRTRQEESFEILNLFIFIS